jgi:hypothetical protein
LIPAFSIRYWIACVRLSTDSGNSISSLFKCLRVGSTLPGCTVRSICAVVRASFPFFFKSPVGTPAVEHNIRRRWIIFIDVCISCWVHHYTWYSMQTHFTYYTDIFSFTENTHRSGSAQWQGVGAPVPTNEKILTYL